MDIPPSRGGLPVPLQVVFQGKGFGAAGLGWDLPLSYVYVDRSLNRRRPALAAGANVSARDRITLALPGRTIEMLPQGTRWIGRYAADVSMRNDGTTWTVFDGNGLTYTFTQNSLLVGTGGPFAGSSGLWLLSAIKGPGGVSVALTYDIQSRVPYGGAAAISIDLVRIDYNSHPTTAGCYKNTIELNYSAIQVGAPPIGLSVMGNRAIARYHTLASVDVMSKATCTSTAERLRRYSFSYSLDADTKRQQLSSVSMGGRQDTPEANSSLPVATYKYGAATMPGPKFEFATTASEVLHLPAGANLGDGFGGTRVVTSTSLFQPPVAANKTYATFQSFVDMTGDGLPDLIFRQNDRLMLARQLPGIFDDPVVLNDNTFLRTLLDIRTSSATRHVFDPRIDVVRENIWTQTVDVNGDGRLDVIDAAEKPDHWIIYLNTPDSGPSGIKWQRRAYHIRRIYDQLILNGHGLSGGYLPLSRRVTGRDHGRLTCWRWDKSAKKYISEPQLLTAPNIPSGCNQPYTYPLMLDVEKTFTEWEINDINGDGYPDFVLNTKSGSFISDTPTTPNGKPNYFIGEEKRRLLLGTGNRIQTAFNVRGMFIPDDLNGAAADPFSGSIEIGSGGCGVGLWQGRMATSWNGVTKELQENVCTIRDINGDGIPDRIVTLETGGTTADLGTGYGFSSVAIKLPESYAFYDSHVNEACDGAPQNSEAPVRQQHGYRDITGDGIPDFIRRRNSTLEVFPGNGLAFDPGSVAIPISGTFDGMSSVFDHCGGEISRTTSGFFDSDGDGRPELAYLDTDFDSLHFRPLMGPTPGSLEAGRLIEVSSGYGATTVIGYANAKKDWRSKHQSPSPEIVVSSMETRADLGLGERIAKTTYAYGGLELMFDSSLDAFRPIGYTRRVALRSIPGAQGESLGAATIDDAHGLDAVTTVTLPFMTSTQRFGRYLKAGRPKESTVLTGSLSSDAWSFLSTVLTSDTRRVAAVQHQLDTIDTRLFTDTTAPTNDLCRDMMFPYDFETSDSYNVAAYNPCSARGFQFSRGTTSWRGTAAPPATTNVQTTSAVRSVDNFGRATSVVVTNDAVRSDDDLCVDVTYATPAGTNERVLTALASRKAWNCLAPEGTQPVYAEESWEYDKLVYGSVSQGLVTGHTVYRHDADTGAYLSTIREFDADWTVAATPLRVIKTREDGATRTTTLTQDPFALVTVSTAVSGTGLPTLTTTSSFDPLTNELLSTTDPNGTVRGQKYDGFGRPVVETVDSPAGSPKGVVAAHSYFGFSSSESTFNQGRRITTKTFTDPVLETQISTQEGRIATTFLDELGRTRFQHADLGDDYANQKMVVGRTKYDQHGRVTFVADPHPLTESEATAYGTTNYYTKDGQLWVQIRGRGPQSFTYASNPTLETYPTIHHYGYENNLAVYVTQAPDSVTAGTPQANVMRGTYSTALGRTVTTSTVQGALRLEHATATYDRLGNTTQFTRFHDSQTPSTPVTWTWKHDSLGQVLQLSEPSSSVQTRSYSNWGELTATTWLPLAPYASRSVHTTYDAYGRIGGTEERNNNVQDPLTVRRYYYDTPTNSTHLSPTFVLGRLARSTSISGDETVSYDALGNVNGRGFKNPGSQWYYERHGIHADGSEAWIELKLPDNAYQAERVDYAYDSAGRMRWMWAQDPLNTYELFDASQVDVFGRVRYATLARSNINYEATYADTGRRLIAGRRIHSTQGSRAIDYLGFDSVGRELRRLEDVPNHDRQFTYDALGRLKTDQSIRRSDGLTALRWLFSYDPIGNITQIDDQIASLDVLMQYYQNVDKDRACIISYNGFGGPQCNVSYDNLGNIISQPTRTGTRTHDFFNDGNIRRIQDQTGRTADFRYDASGRVAQLDITSGATIWRQDRRYGGMVRERKQQGPFGGSTFTERSFPGPGVTISRRGATGTWIFQFSDQNGTRVTADYSGAFVQDIAYLSFGEALSAGAQIGDIRYTTEQWNGGDALDGFGLAQLGARVYDPATGRFISRDPLLIRRSAATSNPYAFALNDPINLSDPSGLDVCAAESTSCYAGLAALGAIGATLYLLTGGAGASSLPDGSSSADNAAFYRGYVNHFNRMLGSRAATIQNELSGPQAMLGLVTGAAAGFGGLGAAAAVDVAGNLAINMYVITRDWPIKKQAAFIGMNAPVTGNFFAAGTALRQHEWGTAFISGLLGGAELFGVRILNRGLTAITNRMGGLGVGGGGGGGGGGASVARIAVGELPAAEQASLAQTLAHIDSGTVPTPPHVARHWGDTFQNRVRPGAATPDLPGGSGTASPYREYRVAPPPGTPGGQAGPFRVVVNTLTGDVYYTWTHYGQNGMPAFVQIR